jgi:site-specific recombinase XerD
VEDGFLFDPNSGLPEQWVRQFKSYAEVASEYSAVKWGEWSASSRQSFCDGAAIVVYESIRPKFKNTYPILETLKVIREFILNKNSLKASERQLRLRAHILENSYRLKEITPEIVTITIQAISKKMNGEISSADTQRRRKQTFGAVMDFAFRQNYIKENSFKRVKIKPSQTLKAIDPVKALNPQECRAYCGILRNLAKIKKGYYMEAADFLEIIWLAGLRPSEVAGLQAKTYSSL